MSRTATRRSPRPSAPRRVSGPAGRAPSTAAARAAAPAPAPSRRAAAPSAGRAGRPTTPSSGRGTRLGDAVRGAVATRSGAATAAAVAIPAPAPRPRPRAVPAPAPRRPVPGRGRLAGSPFVAQVRALPDHRLLDRLLRSRAWIVLLGLALGGIVAMQVSLLGMNAGISQAVIETTALQQDRATLQEQISELSDGQRLRENAAANGMILPSAGDADYLTARGQADARAAAAGITPPSEAAKGLLSSTASTDTAAGRTPVEQLTAPAVGAAAASDPSAPDPTATAEGTTATADPALPSAAGATG